MLPPWLVGGGGAGLKDYTERRKRGGHRAGIFTFQRAREAY
jgi:hypothetical protein